MERRATETAALANMGVVYTPHRIAADTEDIEYWARYGATRDEPFPGDRLLLEPGEAYVPEVEPFLVDPNLNPYTRSLRRETELHGQPTVVTERERLVNAVRDATRQRNLGLPVTLPGGVPCSVHRLARRELGVPLPLRESQLLPEGRTCGEALERLRRGVFVRPEDVDHYVAAYPFSPALARDQDAPVSYPMARMLRLAHQHREDYRRRQALNQADPEGHSPPLPEMRIPERIVALTVREEDDSSVPVPRSEQ